MAQIESPAGDPGTPAKGYSVSGIILVIMVMATIIGLVVMVANTPHPLDDQYRAERAAAVAARRSEIQRMMPVARDILDTVERRPPPARRTAPPARNQSHRRMAFADCINNAADMADAIGIAPAISQSSSGNVVSARFEFRDGAVVITCSRAEGVMTVERR